MSAFKKFLHRLFTILGIPPPGTKPVVTKEQIDQGLREAKKQRDIVQEKLRRMEAVYQRKREAYLKADESSKFRLREEVSECLKEKKSLETQYASYTINVRKLDMARRLLEQEYAAEAASQGFTLSAEQWQQLLDKAETVVIRQIEEGKEILDQGDGVEDRIARKALDGMDQSTPVSQELDELDRLREIAQDRVAAGRPETPGRAGSDRDSERV